MKILFVSSDKFPPFRVDVSELFGRELVGRGHTIDWLLHSEEDCKQAYTTEWMDSKVYVGATDTGESLYARIKKHWLSIANDLRMFKLARQSDYDFLLVKDKFIAALMAMIVCRRSSTKFIYWLSYPFPEASMYEAKTGVARYPLLYRIRGLCFDVILYRLIARFARHLFVQSAQMKRDLADRGVASELMTPVPMGIAQATFSTLAGDQASLQEDGADIVYLGTLLGARKMDFLVRTLKIVTETLPRARLLYVGDGETPEDRAQIDAEAQRLGLSDQVDITGFLPQKEALALARSARVCVSPFYPTPILNSTSPTKLIEYMALGKAVVANDHPEQSQVIAESGAGICTAYNEQEFAAAIVSLLSDPELRQSMGEKGRRYALEHRSYDRISAMVEARLNSLLEAPDE